MEKTNIIDVCIDYIYPDRELLKNLDNTVDLRELISILGKIRSTSGRNLIRDRMSVVAMDGFDSDINICSLCKRLSFAQFAEDNKNIKYIETKIDDVVLIGLKKDRDLNSLCKRKSEAISAETKQRIEKQLCCVVQEKVKTEECVEYLKEMLNVIHNQLIVSILETKIDKLSCITDGLYCDTDEKHLFQRIKDSYSEDSRIKIKERIDDIRGVFESIRYCCFEELVSLHEFVLSNNAYIQIHDRMYCLISEIDPVNPPEWFAGLLNNPLCYLNKCIVKNKANEIIEKNK